MPVKAQASQRRTAQCRLVVWGITGVLLAGPAGFRAATQDADARVEVRPDGALRPYAEALATICDYAITQAEAAGLVLPERVTVHAVQREHSPSYAVARDGSILLVAYLPESLGPSQRAQFARYREVSQVQRSEDGSLLLWGFEDAAELETWLPINWRAEIAEEHATEGQRCVRIATTETLGDWFVFSFRLPLWGKRDWRGYSALAFDVYNDSDADTLIEVQVFDKRDRSHGQMPAFTTVPARTQQPCSLAFRLEDIGEITFVCYPDSPPTVLYIDNVRLVP
jgi:hypothetical protein